MCSYCATWARMGECTRNPGWMLTGCPVACKQCGNQVRGYGDDEDVDEDVDEDGDEDGYMIMKTYVPVPRLQRLLCGLGPGRPVPQEPSLYGHLLCKGRDNLPLPKFHLGIQYV